MGLQVPPGALLQVRPVFSETILLWRLARVNHSDHRKTARRRLAAQSPPNLLLLGPAHLQLRLSSQPVPPLKIRPEQHLPFLEPPTVLRPVVKAYLVKVCTNHFIAHFIPWKSSTFMLLTNIRLIDLSSSI